MGERTPLPTSVTQPLSGEASHELTPPEAQKPDYSRQYRYDKTEKGKKTHSRYQKTERGAQNAREATKCFQVNLAG